MNAGQRLCASPLNEREREALLLRINDLTKFLGSPGDWGYGTKLGDLTVTLLDLRKDIAAQPARAEGAR